MLLLALACSGPALDPPRGDTQDSAVGPGPWVQHPGGVVELVADDGTVLVGDFYPAAAEGRPSMLLYGDFYATRETVAQSFIQSSLDRGWNVLVMDWRSFGDSGGDEYISDAAYLDIEVAVGFVQEQGRGPAPAMFGGTCAWALIHAYKAETLQDRTQIAGFGMMPFTDYGVCNVFNPDQMPRVPTLFVVGPLDDAADKYLAAPRDNWVFLSDWGQADGWTRLEDASYEDTAALNTAIFDFFDQVHGGEFR